MILISDFLTDIYDYFALSDKMQILDDFSKEIYIIIYLDKNNNRWWKTNDLINQVVEYTILIFKTYFSEYQALFAFDNALSYTTFSSNMLITKYMNLSSNKK